MEDIENGKIRARYLLATVLMLFFVVNDLVFDFVFDFGGSDYISFSCTLIAAIIVFYCNFAIKRRKLTSEFENAETFIKSNFDNWQVVFSVLDIICGAISILSGLAFLGAIFKVVKIGYVPVKITVVTNKGKSIVKAAAKVGLLWTSGRLLSEQNNNRENEGMFKKIGLAFKNVGLWIYSNKKTILGTIAAIASGVATAMAVHSDIIAFLPALVVFNINVTPYFAGLLMFGLTELGVTGKGFETIKEFFARIAAEKDKKAEEKALKEQEKKQAETEKEKKIAQKKFESDEKKAAKLLKKLEAEEKALEEKKAAEAAKKAEEDRINALVEELKAKKEAAEQQQKVDTGAN